MIEKKDAYWYCPKCGFKESIWNKYYWKCPRCGSPLKIIYDKTFEPRGNGLPRYSSLFPFKPVKTIGEGGTPLVIDEENNVKLLFKLEYLNPSGSFKDRGTALAIGYSYLLGYKSVVEDTSGNTGISVTLYSRVYGLKPLIIMPKNAPLGKKKLVKLLGGKIVEAKNRGEASKIVSNYIESSYYVAHTWSYFYIIGASTISYEVYEEYGVPDYVIVPVGSGGLFLGLMNGFEHLYIQGLIRHVPKPVVVQGYSVQPVYEKLYGKKIGGEESDLADGIMVPNPPRINEILEYMGKYGGKIVLVGNSEIKQALLELLDKGFIVEPTSAAVYAAYKKMIDEFRGKEVLLPLTGSGLKMVS
ncbi:pyridoxal-phosphate dependent enzyme [Staphylothermus hellenicus]|uniref:Pyridoxal-5'-phosphate-dependent protein beta subunit n=1 Tax=Staphylothermus hellenicus (strain DSM 12710 / JCM 10830 / BK20S6-10-b1 / P8) TaxID=591019 RepID=D7DA76_STAHD|nr:pyridoxal-phosphate dependent enzyme [Staphylothermus hellenicus]ADI32672.1 Pyridoxal-5'-phosphate-dependent protein beta subunit [Staphylothermus hellenicus DSM 12710]